MQVICPISGIAWQTAPYMAGIAFSDVHPIFRVARHKLVNADFVHRFDRAQATEEKRLYFLAAINSTDLVSFNCIANPTLATIERHFLKTCSLVGWIDLASYSLTREVAFPRFVVNSDNQVMDNVGHWLDSISEIQKKFQDKDADRERSFRISQEHDKLKKEFVNAMVKERAFTPFTIRWAFEFCGLEEHPRADKYFSILNTDLKKAWTLDELDLERIQDLFTDRLPLSHPMAATFFGQLQQLIRAQKVGFADFAIMDSPEEPDQNPQAPRIPRVSVHQSMRKTFLVLYGNMNEPVQKDFPTRFTFLKAHAQWELAKAAPEEEEPLSVEEQVLEELNNFQVEESETEEAIEEPVDLNDENGNGEEDGTAND